MDVSLRLLRAEDIGQVAVIEREAFSPLWVATPFERELNNRYARYLVACCPRDPENPTPPSPQQWPQEPTDSSFWSRVVAGIQGLAKRGQPPPPQNSFIAGYVSIWFQGDEAHITEIAVRERLRNLGIGELLLIASVQAAVERGSSVMTLEVRASNSVAQRLYEKYGFRSAGLRQAYYSDNREDAVIMTTDHVHSQEYQRMFQQLQEEYRSRRREICVDF